jgi:GNAT superfamily N-acetyltransferase
VAKEKGELPEVAGRFGMVSVMKALQEGYRAGIDYLEAVTALLHRVRCADPMAGLYEAAEVQWWWARRSRSTDRFDQLFWYDDAGRPAAAVIATEFGDQTQLDPIVMPDESPEWTAHVMERGLAYANHSGVESVTFEVDSADEVLRSVLVARGFAIEAGGGLVESWLSPEARPAVSPLAEGYRLSSRLDNQERPHHIMNAARGHHDPEPRLRQTSLYRADLDLVVYDRDDRVAAYGLFWYDPETGVGVVEPMRTDDDHQQRGLARHVLTSGIDLLVSAGAARVKICFEPDNAASKHLYLGAGFVPARNNDMCSGSTSARPV